MQKWYPGPMPLPPAVFIDAGGVLLLPHLAGMAERFGIHASQADLVAAFYRSYEQRIAGEDEIDWLWRAFMQQFHLESSAIEGHLGDLRQEGIDPWTWVITAAPEGRWLLAELASAGITATIVSNSSGQVESMLATADVCQVGEGPNPPVHDVIDSSRVGVAKPEPGIFDIALARLPEAVERSQVVHIGDALWSDVKGAEAAGIQPLHFDPAAICPAPEGHPHVETLREAWEWLTA